MNKNTNTKIFFKLILKILKIDWEQAFPMILIFTLIIFSLFSLIYLGKEPKCDVDKRIEFMEKCLSWDQGGFFVCEELSKDLYCTKKFF